MTIKAVMKPGHEHITIAITSIAQRIIPIIVVEFYLLLIVPGESRGLSEVVSLSRDGWLFTVFLTLSRTDVKMLLCAARVVLSLASFADVHAGMIERVYLVETCYFHRFSFRGYLMLLPSRNAGPSHAITHIRLLVSCLYLFRG